MATSFSTLDAKYLQMPVDAAQSVTMKRKTFNSRSGQEMLLLTFAPFDSIFLSSISHFCIAEPNCSGVPK